MQQGKLKRNNMFKRFGKFISSMKVVYLHQKNNERGNCDDDIDSMLINFEKSNKICFTVPQHEFQDDPNFSGTNDSSIQNDSIPVFTTKNNFGTTINSHVSKL